MQSQLDFVLDVLFEKCGKHGCKFFPDLKGFLEAMVDFAIHRSDIAFGSVFQPLMQIV